MITSNRTQSYMKCSLQAVWIALFFALWGGPSSAARPKPPPRKHTPAPTTRHTTTPAPRRAFSLKARLAPRGNTKRRTTPLPRLTSHGKKPISLTALTRHALLHNPTLERLRRLVAVYQRREQRSDPWPDLQVGVQALNFPLDSFNPTKTAMSGILYSVSQRFPILKRLSLQRKIAQYNTAMAKELIRERSIWVLFQLRQSVLWMSYLRRALQIQAELHRIMGQAASVARIKYTVGKAPQQHYLQAYTAQALIRNQMIALVSKEQIWRHRARQLLGTQANALLGEAPPIPSPQPWMTVKQALQHAMASRGAARRWRIAIQQAKTLLSLAQVRYWPDVTLQLAVRQRFPNALDQGTPFLSVGVKVPLPTWGNAARHGLVQEAMAQHQLARSKLRELRTLYQKQAQIALTQIQQFTQQIQIAQRHTIPLAMQTYHSALSSYQVEKVDFLTLLSNLRTLYKEKLRLDRLRTLRAIAETRLIAISGDILPTTTKAKKK